MLVVAPGKSISGGGFRLIAGTPITADLIAPKGPLTEGDLETFKAGPDPILIEEQAPAPPPKPIVVEVPPSRWEGFDRSDAETVVSVPIRDLKEMLSSEVETPRVEAFRDADAKRYGKSKNAKAAYDGRLEFLASVRR